MQEQSTQVFHCHEISLVLFIKGANNAYYIIRTVQTSLHLQGNMHAILYKYV